MSVGIKYEHRREDIYAWNETNKRRLEYRTPHVHREFELIFYHEGMTVAYVDSVRYELKPGDVFLTFPNQIHSYETHDREVFQLFLIKPDLMPELMNTFDMAVPESAVIPGAANDPKLRMLCDALAELCTAQEENTYRKHLLHGYLLALFSELLSRMKLTGMHLTDSDTLRSIVSYCTKHYDKELSLSVLEENLHLNKYYISHLFSGKLGLRFNDYVNSLRISEACRCLLHSDESITSICSHVGFNTLRTFNRAFIKQVGVSPSEYRKGSVAKEPPALPKAIPLGVSELDKAEGRIAPSCAYCYESDCGCGDDCECC